MELSQLLSKLRRGDLKLIHEILVNRGETISFSHIRLMFCDDKSKAKRPLREDVRKVAEELIESRERLINNEPNE